MDGVAINLWLKYRKLLNVNALKFSLFRVVWLIYRNIIEHKFMFRIRTRKDEIGINE